MTPLKARQERFHSTARGDLRRSRRGGVDLGGF
jgi:hypothetical protein